MILRRAEITEMHDTSYTDINQKNPFVKTYRVLCGYTHIIDNLICSTVVWLITY